MLLWFLTTLMASPVAAALSDYPNKREMVQGGMNYTLHWDVSDGSNFKCAIEIANTGWAGFGISPNGGMTGSDILIAWVDDGGNPHATDRWAVSESTPIEDTARGGQSDWSVVSSFEDADGMVMELTRKLKTGDSNDREISDGNMRVIFAYNTQDPEVGGQPLYHTHRWPDTIDFWGDAPFDPAALPAGTATADFLFPTFTVPVASTSYMCASFNVAIGIASHAIAFEPIVNSPLVHHMIVYKCASAQTTGEVRACGAMDCPSIVFAWAVGSPAWVLPEEAGIDFGPAGYYMVETHYSNPLGLSSQTDNSGVRVYHNPTKRANSAGFLRIGTGIQDLAIPPGQPAWEVRAECSGEVTENIALLPKQKVSVIASMLHMHLRGRQAWISVARAGSDLATLSSDCFYDFNYQSIIPATPSFDLLPGDTIQTHCVYNTEGLSSVTRGGDATEDEMCIAFLVYYPYQESIQTCIQNFVEGSREAQVQCKTSLLGLNKAPACAPCWGLLLGGALGVLVTLRG